jgi:23S rRNA maturation mini-RNase III
MINFDPDDARQKEELFKLKLKIFEENSVRNSKSSDKFKNAKTFIRKAETPLDVLLGYFVFTEQAELQVADKEKFEVEGVYIPIKS